MQDRAVAAVVRHLIEVDDAEPTLGTGQGMFAILGQVAKVEELKVVE